MAINTSCTTCDPIETDPATCQPATVVTPTLSCSTTQSLCSEAACAPVDWNEQGKSLLVTNYNNCPRQLNNKSYSIPHQSTKGCIEWRDGSANDVITLANLQSRTGTSNFILALDANKNLFALEPNKLNGTQTLKYSPDVDAFVFVKDPDNLDSICSSGVVSDSNSPGTCYDLNAISALSSAEASDGVLVLSQASVDGVIKHCLRYVSPTTILGACKPIKEFPTIADTDKVYNAVWKVSNAGIADCECLSLNYEEAPSSVYRKQSLLTSVCVAVDLTDAAVNGATAGNQIYSFATLGIAQPDWANRVIVRASIVPGSVEFDGSSDLSATALIGDASNNLASVKVLETGGSDSAFSGEVSLPIAASGFQVVAGSGIINSGGVLSGSAADLFTAQICVVGFELNELA